MIAMLVALLEYMFFAIRVGGARGKYGVAAPAVTGNPDFERYYRVQQNTLEQLIIMLPSALAFGVFIGDLWAAVAVAVFVIGRAVYYAGYVAAPEKRGIGFLITMLANMTLLIGGLVGALLTII